MLVLTLIIFLLVSQNLLCLAFEVGFRIVGGHACNFKDYPFVVYVISYYLCGGTLIHDEWVLTAAHCFVKPADKDELDEPSHVRARGNSGDENIQKRLSILYVPHPKFDMSKFEDSIDINHDIGLIRINHPFEITPWTRVLPLPKFSKRTLKVTFNWQWGTEKPTQSSNKPTKKPKKYPCLNPTLLAIGDTRAHSERWSYLRDQTLKERKFKCANFHFVPHQMCSRLSKFLNPNSTYCLHDDGYNYACDSDAGGPLVCKNVLLGVMSNYRDTCNGSAVTSRLDYYRNWIDQTISTTARKNLPISRKSGRSGSHKIFLWDSLVCILLLSKFLSGF